MTDATRYCYTAKAGGSQFYDIYPPILGGGQGCAIVVQGGGAAGDTDAGAVIDCVRRQGYWVAAIDCAPGDAPTPPDVREAWAHIHTVARHRHGFADRYIPIGRHAGAAIVSAITLAAAEPATLPGTIAGLILADSPALPTDALRPCRGRLAFPVVMLGGPGPNASVCLLTYDRLRALGYRCLLLVSAQDCHGGICFADALAWCKSPAGTSWKEYRFRAVDDPDWAQLNPASIYGGDPAGPEGPSGLAVERP